MKNIHLQLFSCVIYTISINISLLLAKLLLLGALFLLFLTAFRGLAFPDEGYILNTGQRIYDGQVIYKDFDFVYTPITGFATAFSFWVFGNSIFAERTISLFLALLTGFFLLRLGKRLTPNPYFALIPLLIYSTWGPSHINFIWPGMWAINFAIIGFCLLYEALQRKNNTYFFYSGFLLGLVILTKQNFAAAVLLAVIILFLLIRPIRNRIAQTYLWLGILSPIAVFLIYTLVTGSTWHFLQNSYVHVIQLVLLEGSIDTPLFVGSNVFIARGKFLFYFSPLLLSLIAMYIVWKKDKTKLILLFFVAIFFLFGFRPVTDYVHLAPLLSLTGIPLLVLISAITTIKRFKNLHKKIPFILFALYALLFALIGIWSALFFGYYRWSPPLTTQNTYIDHPRVGIWIDQNTKNQIETINSLLNEYSKPKEEVFLNYYAPMVYFLADRRNPTRYDYTGLPDEYQKQVVQTLEQKKIKTVVTFYLNKNDKTIIGEYIKNNYIFTKKSGEYEVWLRNSKNNSID